MISYCLFVPHSFFQINVTQWDFHQPVPPHSLSLVPPFVLWISLSDSRCRPDVRYSGRVCAAGCRLTLFKTPIISCRLVLQLSTPEAPTAHTDHSTRRNTHKYYLYKHTLFFAYELTLTVCLHLKLST